MAASKSLLPTTSDLIVLALLAERPMHGYECRRELIRREVEDWAAISKAQIYYSFKKLVVQGWAEVVKTPERSEGPDRQVLKLTKAGKAAIQSALARPDWSLQRERPAFLTWLALSHLAPLEVRRAAVKRRKAYLQAEKAKEEETLEAIRTD